MHFDFGIFPILATLLFVLLLLTAGGLALAGGARALRQRQHVLPSPVRIMAASVAWKRAAMRQDWQAFSEESSLSARASLVYYVTFQLEDNSHLEFPVEKALYLTLQSGDTGRLTVQGTQYLRFEPQAVPQEPCS